MIKRERLPAGVRDRLPRLSERFAGDGRIVALYLFGSFARGTEGPLSDLDIALLLGPEVPTADYPRLAIDYLAEITRTLGTDEVSFALLNESPLVLRYEVIRSGRVLLDRRPADRLAFEVCTQDEYLDFKPVLDAYDDALLDQLAGGRR
jgi:predicted nucleotidyltransferase